MFSTGYGNGVCCSGTCWTDRVPTSSLQGEQAWALPPAGQPVLCCQEPLISERALACPTRNAKLMPAAVSEALLFVFQEQGKLSDPEAASYLARLQHTGRFQTETWA